jgi:hypothetical protein
MRDFTLDTFKLLLTALKDQQYTFQTFADFLKNPQPRAIILRHDVDARKQNSLRTARLEYEMGIVGTYNFRMVPQSFDEEVIREIAGMGHEIGYHYEELAITKGNYEKAITIFEKNLANLRQIVPIDTICMHGSPLSRYDNRKLWGKYNYQDYGIIGEPYFELDFGKVLYLTDTGRRWDGEQVSVRDKISGKKSKKGKGEDMKSGNVKNGEGVGILHSTIDIISSAERGNLPVQIMITIHPQRWNDQIYTWMRELIFQNIKNFGKNWIVRRLK